MQKITPFLWFENSPEEAVNFYKEVFGDLKIKNTIKYDAAGAKVSGKPEGSAMTIEFELFGQSFTALNGGKVKGFKFSPAISFVVSCETQEEVDKYWNALSAVPAAEQCGWLTDMFGITWQIIPSGLSELLRKDKSGKVMAAMLKMKKIIIKDLETASRPQ
jgi:predicted 3-demethylubiquinone-9 3-methyltransferase (glyoxalase superfamily)